MADMRAFENLLTEALTKNHLQITEVSKDKLSHYLALLSEWNRIFNLTTITDPRDMVYLHIIDSLSVQPYLEGRRCLDVGSGAGLPGIPLAIINPEQNWVLLDKNSKKTRFLTQAIAELKLSNVTAVHGRALEYHPKECFDSILSRALGTIHMFIEETEHLLCPNGVLIAMKGKYPAEELSLISNRYEAHTKRAEIHGMDVERHLVCLKRKH